MNVLNGRNIVGSTNLGQVVTTIPTCSTGVEFVGSVTPSNYTGAITFRRTIISLATWNGSSPEPTNLKPGDDTSDPPFLDTDPQSCNGTFCSSGKVYDVDSPGITAIGGIIRTRKNFNEWGALGGPSIPTFIAVPVSPNFFWWARSSCVTRAGQVGFSTDVVGDNQSGLGTTPLTPDLH